MRQKVFHLLAAISFMVAAATVVVCVQSHIHDEDKRIATVADLSLFVSRGDMSLLSLHLVGVDDREPDPPTADPAYAAELASWRDREREIEIKDQRGELLDGGLLPSGRFAFDDKPGVSFVRDAFPIPMGGNGRFGCRWSHWRLTLPCWLIAGGASVLPAFAIRSGLRSIARRARGRCIVCGMICAHRLKSAQSAGRSQIETSRRPHDRLLFVSQGRCATASGGVLRIGHCQQVMDRSEGRRIDNPLGRSKLPLPMPSCWKYFDPSNATYERFTERARLVFALAEHFAVEQGSPDISPEHILRGLACGSSGIGRTVLNGLGVDLLRLLPEVMQLLPSYPARPLPPMEELMANPARYFPDPEFSRGARKCLEATWRAAAGLNHNYLGTEHLVLGLLSHESPAAAFLRGHGVNFESAKSGIVELLHGKD